MKVDIPVVIMALLAAALTAGAVGFDSAAWEEKRAMHLVEAERLKVAYTNFSSRIESPAEDVRMPLETFADGSVKAIVTARRAQYFLKSGFIWAEGVVIRRYRADKTLEGQVEAENCVVDRYSRSGWANGSAKVSYGKTVVRGRRVYFSSPDAYVRVFDDAEIESDEAKLPEGGSKSRHAHIVGKGCDFDHQLGVAMFGGNVRMDYAGEYTLCSDQAYAFLSGSNELGRVVAVGKVAITNATRVGACATAIYRHRRREIEMFGGADGSMAHLEDTGRNAGTVDGTRIRFWLDAEQFEVDNSVITVEERGERSLL